MRREQLIMEQNGILPMTRQPPPYATQQVYYQQQQYPNQAAEQQPLIHPHNQQV